MFDTNIRINTLAAKIAAASLKVGALKADKQNTHQNYWYISADKILERAGDALANEGICVVPTIIREDTVQVDYTDSYGKSKSRFDTAIFFDMILSDGESQMIAPWCGRGSDSSSPDKALYKAITSGHKYFLAKLLNIGVGNEDGEHEDETPKTERNGRGPANHTVPPPKTQQPPSTSATEDGSDGPTPEELEVIAAWRGPTDAQMWAMKEGYCTNEHHARESFKKVVADQFGGKFTLRNQAEVLLAFYRHQLEKVPA